MNSICQACIMLVLAAILSCSPSYRRTSLIFTYTDKDTLVASGRYYTIDTSLKYITLYTMRNGKFYGPSQSIRYADGIVIIDHTHRNIFLNRMYELDYINNRIRLIKRVTRGYSSGKWYYPKNRKAKL
jgi:hypothetical protein